MAITHEGMRISAFDLAVDTSGSPTILDLGDLQFYVIERSGRYGLRVRDRNHPARFGFPGIETFPIDARWRITGRLEAYDPPRTIPIPDVLGQVNHLESPGTTVFDIRNQSYRLDALPGPDGEPLPDLRGSDFRPRDLRRRAIPLQRTRSRRRQRRPRLQQVLQPALCLHRLRDLPTAPKAEQATGAHRSRRKEATAGTARPGWPGLDPQFTESKRESRPCGRDQEVSRGDSIRKRMGGS